MDPCVLGWLQSEVPCGKTEQADASFCSLHQVRREGGREGGGGRGEGKGGGMGGAWDRAVRLEYLEEGRGRGF